MGEYFFVVGWMVLFSKKGGVVIAERAILLVGTDR